MAQVTNLSQPLWLKYTCASWEAQSDELFKDPDMLRRLQEINSLPQKDKDCILYNLDAVLRDVKTRKAYATTK